MGPAGREKAFHSLRSFRVFIFSIAPESKLSSHRKNKALPRQTAGKGFFSSRGEKIIYFSYRIDIQYPYLAY